MEISKRDEKKIQRSRLKLHHFDMKRTDSRTELVFHRCDCCEYKISCINFRIFESISRKSENYDSSVPFFSLAALNYGHGRIVPGEMQIGAHSRLQFVTSFRTDFAQFIVEDDKDIQTG